MLDDLFVFDFSSSPSTCLLVVFIYDYVLFSSKVYSIIIICSASSIVLHGFRYLGECVSGS